MVKRKKSKLKNSKKKSNSLLQNKRVLLISLVSVGIIAVILFLSIFGKEQFVGKAETAFVVNVLLAGYTFDSDYTDLTNNYQNPVSEGVTFENGIRDDSIKLAGNKDSYISLEKEILNERDDFSVSMWIKTTDKNTGILSAANTGQDNELLFFIGSNNNLQVFMKGKKEEYSGLGVNNGRWHHLTITRDSNDLKLYFDGNLKNPISNVDFSSSALNVQSFILGQEQDKRNVGQSSNQKLIRTIGNTEFTIDSGQAFNGQIDELKFFNYALSGNEVSSIYKDITAVPKVTFYEHTNYRGKSVAITADNSNLVALTKNAKSGWRGWNDQASSLKIKGWNTVVLLFEHTNYRGRSVLLKGDNNNLVALTENAKSGWRGWNDQASSIKIVPMNEIINDIVDDFAANLGTLDVAFAYQDLDVCKDETPLPNILKKHLKAYIFGDVNDVYKTMFKFQNKINCINTIDLRKVDVALAMAIKQVAQTQSGEVKKLLLNALYNPSIAVFDQLVYSGESEIYNVFTANVDDINESLDKYDPDKFWVLDLRVTPGSNSHAFINIKAYCIAGWCRNIADDLFNGLMDPVNIGVGSCGMGEFIQGGMVCSHGVECAATGLDNRLTQFGGELSTSGVPPSGVELGSASDILGKMGGGIYDVSSGDSVWGASNQDIADRACGIGGGGAGGQNQAGGGYGTGVAQSCLIAGGLLPDVGSSYEEATGLSTCMDTYGPFNFMDYMSGTVESVLNSCNTLGRGGGIREGGDEVTADDFEVKDRKIKDNPIVNEKTETIAIETDDKKYKITQKEQTTEHYDTVKTEYSYDKEGDGGRPETNVVVNELTTQKGTENVNTEVRVEFWTGRGVATYSSNPGRTLTAEEKKAGVLAGGVQPLEKMKDKEWSLVVGILKIMRDKKGTIGYCVLDCSECNALSERSQNLMSCFASAAGDTLLADVGTEYAPSGQPDLGWNINPTGTGTSGGEDIPDCQENCPVKMVDNVCPGKDDAPCQVDKIDGVCPANVESLPAVNPMTVSKRTGWAIDYGPDWVPREAGGVPTGGGSPAPR